MYRKSISGIISALMIISLFSPFASAASSARADADAVTLSVIAQYDSGNDKITRSLYLPDKGSVNNSAITWKSSDTKHITNSGRVIRPKYDEADAAVTMTAVIANGTESIEKNFNLTVKKDERFIDPQHMSDEEFFGNGSDKVGKLDYSIDGLRNVKNFAYSGDYAKAKEALLTYFKSRAVPFYRDKNLGKVRNAAWAEFVLDDFYHMGSSEYYKGDIIIGAAEDDYSAELSPSEVKNGYISFGIRARYNESSRAEIFSKDNANSALAPRMRVTVNGQERIYTAVKDTYVRFGEYSNTPYGNENILKVKTFGDFLENETYQATVTFDFSDIKDTDTVTGAALILHGAVYPSSAENKTLVIVKEGNTTYDESAAARYTFPGMIYSYNGLPSKNSWQKVTGQEGEYFWQSSRFMAWQTIALEYDCTGNEDYVYDAMAIAADYINDTGGRKFIGSSYTQSDDGLRGGFPRTLDAAVKNNAFEKTLDYFKTSKYFTAEHLSAILKNIWDTAHYLTVYHSESENWYQHEMVSLLNTTLYIPEFKDVKSGEQWQKYATDALENMLFLNSMSDGSYVESSTGYSIAAFSDFASFKQEMLDLGIDVSDEYNNLLLKAAYYNAMLYYPNGKGLSYGDATKSSINAGTFAKTCSWFNAEDLKYITTLGKSGVEPEYTSYHWGESRVTVMRDSWNVNSPYLFTNVRGGGGHGHADDNQIVLYAYGRELLPDRGMFSYATNSELKEWTEWGKSSLAHSTVVINDTSQSYKEGIKGTVKNVVLEDDYNYLKQSTANTEGYDHERAILYLKPDLWIVSDKVTPQDMSKTNNYKQKWFTNYDANISSENRILRSNYDTGANIVIASADEGTELHIDDCVYDRSTNELVETKYGYYQKEQQGICRFDTLLTATENDPDAAVKAETLHKDENSAAIRFETTRNGNTKIIYYSRSEGGVTQFGDFETDGTAAAVVCDADGTIENAVRNGGSYIKNVKTGQLIEGKAPEGIFNAGKKNNICAVYGTMDRSFAGKIVVGMLTPKEKENIEKEDIIWTDACAVDENGQYLFRFTLNDDPEKYRLKLNIQGLPYIQNITQTADDGKVIRAVFNAQRSDEVINGVLKLENLYLQENIPYTFFLAFYDKGGKLIKVNALPGVLADDVCNEIKSSYPADTESVKAFIWKDMISAADIKQNIGF